MQELQDTTEKENITNLNNRRRRIKRIKITIIITAIVLMILPTILCIILGVQVLQLQQKVNQLISISGSNDIHKGETHTKDGKYAYAAVKKQPEEAIKEEEIVFAKPDTKVEIPFIEIEALNEQQTSIIESNSSDGIYSGKKVYLTFDDGPSKYTEDILDILAEYDVKATFFVIGKTDEASKRIYRRIIEEGHTLGMHSYSHIYDQIYNSLEDFDKDFTKLWKLLYDTIGYNPTIYRFPGGSGNHVSKNNMDQFIRYLNEKSIVYFDWNVLNRDATGVEYTKDQLIENVLSGVINKRVSIVLLHEGETKKSTVESLPELLEELLTLGAELLPLDENVTPIQHINAKSIK